MSASRSVAAAQRRRAGPPEPQVQRGPNTSINSSQVFSQQQQQQPNLRPGTSGRLAGQQAALQQQQFQQQQQGINQNQNQNQQQQPNSKMSVAQAITLITLRLGRIENQLNNLDPLTSGNLVNENGEVVDSNLIESIMQRLELLEQEQEKEEQKQSNNDLTFVQDELFKFKQLLETFKTSIISIKNSSAVNTKEIKNFKTLLDELKSDLSNTKLIIEELQDINYNENEIYNENEDLDQNINENECINENINENINEENYEQLSEILDNNIELETELIKEFKTDNIINEDLLVEDISIVNDNSLNLSENIEEKEGISLKEIIQKELKQSGVSLNTNTNTNTNTNKRNSKLKTKN